MVWISVTQGSPDRGGKVTKPDYNGGNGQQLQANSYQDPVGAQRVWQWLDIRLLSPTSVQVPAAEAQRAVAPPKPNDYARHRRKPHQG